MSKMRTMRRRMTNERAIKMNHSDLVDVAQNQHGFDRFHARIYAHGTTISPAGCVPPPPPDQE
jgi:hypothetical protein